MQSTNSAQIHVRVGIEKLLSTIWRKNRPWVAEIRTALSKKWTFHLFIISLRTAYTSVVREGIIAVNWPNPRDKAGSKQ